MKNKATGGSKLNDSPDSEFFMLLVKSKNLYLALNVFIMVWKWDIQFDGEVAFG